jgi:murein DD-endopeptidase MepM/ murein hydrolase activator NlpD
MSSEDFSNFLNSISKEQLHVLDASIPVSAYIPIDLSESNSDLNHFDVTSSMAWQDYIDTYLYKNNKTVAYGGYCERRSIYKRSSYFNYENGQDERNIHLGIDLWIEANSKIYSPLDGTVHSFKNNINCGDYGPTIILRHFVLGEEFYTLYGHLSLKSIIDIQVGHKFKAGDCIATLGDSKINGDYAPHLHFQIIRDIKENYGDYPGVCSKKNLDSFLKNCPDPNTLLKLNFN